MAVPLFLTLKLNKTILLFIKRSGAAIGRTYTSTNRCTDTIINTYTNTSGRFSKILNVARERANFAGWEGVCERS